MLPSESEAASHHAIKILFASGSPATIAQTLEKFRNIFPNLHLVVVSEFPPEEGEWIPYHIRRSLRENCALIRSRLRGRKIRLSALILEPRIPYRRMRLAAVLLDRWSLLGRGALLAFNETGQHFLLRPDNIAPILRNLIWRTKNFVRSQSRPGGRLHGTAALLRDRCKRRLQILYLRARIAPLLHRRRIAAPEPWPARQRLSGISVVIPSRNGRDLLSACLPSIEGADETIVVDNGSQDGTAAFLHDVFPQVSIETSPEPLSFARAVNRGIQRSRFSHVCLLNNDMRIEPGFLESLRRAFEQVPNLFAATAQIFFPEGQRREETGKTVWVPALAATDFPVRCEAPLEGEDLSYVLYGSGGCTLYDAAKLETLGGFDTIYDPAYVEDLDLGVRAWQHGWPSVYCAGARVLHRHRATTSRYFTPQELDRILENNFVRFLARCGGAGIWTENLVRLRAAGKEEPLRAAAKNPINTRPQREEFLSLVNGDTAVFPGRARSVKPAIVIASPYLPFPLSHGAAVRIYNLMRRAAADFDQVLVSFVEQAAPAPRELLEICSEIVTVRRAGTHALPSTSRPDTVEEFDSPAFHAALQQTIGKWNPGVVQLEFTQMAQYASDCKLARTILVEHDITYDLYSQMLGREEDWEIRRQYERWLCFESAAWRSVDRVVTMSEKDRSIVPGSVVIPNGVDLKRFRPSGRAPEPRRLLFIGSFAHRPNVLALEFFLRDIFPLLPDAALHVIAGERHERFWNLQHPGVEVEGFVADVRPAYERAAVVIAPLVASAGTNIKIMEAMAMGKAIVSTDAGIHGLELESGRDLIVANAPQEIAAGILRLFECPEERAAIESRARNTAERLYGWDAIAAVQKRLYLDLLT